MGWYRQVFVGFLLSCLLVAFPESVQAQEQVESDTLEQAVPDSLIRADSSDFAISDIARLLEEASVRLREVQSNITPSQNILQIESDLDDFEATIEGLKQDYLNKTSQSVSSRVLENMRRTWGRMDLQWRRWESDLNRRLDILEQDREWIQQSIETYEARRERPELPAFMERADAFYAELLRVQVELFARIDSLLLLADRFSQIGLTIDEYLGQIADLQKQSQRQLWIRDSSVYWVAFFARQNILNSEEIVAHYRNDLDALDEFIETYPLQQVFHLIIFLVLLSVIVVLKRRSQQWPEEDEGMQAALYIIRRPFSTALLMSLLTTGWLYPNAPTLVTESAIMLSFLPILRLMPGFTHPTMRPALYGFLALYFVYFQTGTTLASDSFFNRTVFLLAETLGFLGLLYLLRPGGAALALSEGPWWKTTLIFARVAFVLLGVAMAANLLGFISLSDYLSEGVFQSTYIAIVFFAAVRVIEGGLTVLFRSRLARSLYAIRSHTDLFVKRSLIVVRFGLLFWWLSVVLDSFQLSVSVKNGFASFFAAGFEIGDINISVGSVLAFIGTIWAARLISRFIRFLLSEDVFPRLVLRRGVPSAISNLTNYVVLFLGFVIAFSAAGLDFTNIALLMGAFGIGIGFGLQTIVNNFISGLILIFERPIQIGDTIHVNTAQGPLLAEVQRIGIRSSTVRTFEGAEVIVPNSNLVATDVTNWTKSDPYRRIEVLVGVAYGSDPKQVIALLEEVGNSQSDALKDPQPRAFFLAFGESSLDFSLRLWTADFDNFFRIKSEVTVAVHEALAEANIEIPFPQRDLHLRSSEATVVTEALNAKPKSLPESRSVGNEKGLDHTEDAQSASAKGGQPKEPIRRKKRADV